MNNEKLKGGEIEKEENFKNSENIDEDMSKSKKRSVTKKILSKNIMVPARRTIKTKIVRGNGMTSIIRRSGR